MSALLTRIAVWWTDRQFHKDLEEMEDIAMTYKLMKRIIQKGGYDYEATLLKLDVFLMADRITVEEYQELVEMMNGGAE
ncbi:MAG: hypothetical protein IJ649_04680 [Oscillospiraceae bacterium]|nr:hypothetical protein [Oscillospiraceae bacterium]